ncbi:hypothetical protein GIB67_034547 [Kingdonia uniflora]|uniref:Uncharacterized protein n=1 Tax=Kingdonia uniflora TaxID=39325 RepID=A0A7J7PB53_9MAGN|nr:hypothetical protein GIB67_034547 [Kingdonia uniflora]
MGSSNLDSVNGVVGEIMNIHKSLPKRKCYACFKSKEHKREAHEILDRENVHIMFDEFVQRAPNCLTSSPSSSNETITYSESLISTMAKAKVDGIGFGGVGSLIRRPKIKDSALKPVIEYGQDGEKLSPFSLDSLTGLYVKKGLGFDMEGIAVTLGIVETCTKLAPIVIKKDKLDVKKKGKEKEHDPVAMKNKDAPSNKKPADAEVNKEAVVMA